MQFGVGGLFLFVGLGLGLAAPVGLTAAEIEPARPPLAHLPVITTVAYITAHPDDESGPVITYLARGLGARVVILSLTRGEGGQNTYGPELGEELGRLRTAELEAAARIDGAEVRFVGALDFGYSKSVDETLLLWDQPALLARLVRALRELKPDVIISRWTPDAPAGAQHQAAGLIARQAYERVGDATAFPEQLVEGLAPWPAPLFLTHATGPDDARTLRVPVEEIHPATGKSYEEIGWEGVRQHRTQGLDRLVRPRPGARAYFLRVESRPSAAAQPSSTRELVRELNALPALFPALALGAEWETRLGEVTNRVRAAERDSLSGDAAAAARKLVEAAQALEALRQTLLAAPAGVEAERARALVAGRQAAWLRAAAEVLGVRLHATADRSAVAAGERFAVRVEVSGGEALARAGLELRDLHLGGAGRVEMATSETSRAALAREFGVILLEGMPAQTVLEAEAVLEAGTLAVPLTALVRGPSSAEAAGPAPPLAVVPRVQLRLEPALRLLPTSQAGGRLDLEVRVEARSQALPLAVSLEVPPGWPAPPPQTVETKNPTPSPLQFQLALPARLEPGTHSLRALACPRPAPTRTRARAPATEAPCKAANAASSEVTRLGVVEVSPPAGLRIGYVGFSDDPVPGLLEQLGIGVERLDETRLAGDALEAFDAIVVAERAYDFRTDLPAQTPRLLDYVKRGGTLVVEHQSSRAWQEHKPTPYPASMSGASLRITREDSPVRFLVAAHPALAFPHRLELGDFGGWVQERGLYFLGEWDARFTPLVEMVDPGEEPVRGGLLYARHGEGVYIYCGLALFRQVRAGVGGGIRLFVNLLSQRRAPR